MFMHHSGLMSGSEMMRFRDLQNDGKNPHIIELSTMRLRERVTGSIAVKATLIEEVNMTQL